MANENKNQYFNIENVYKGLELNKDYENDQEFVNSLLNNAWTKLNEQLKILEKIDDINKENNKDDALSALSDVKEISECIFVDKITAAANELEKSINGGKNYETEYKKFVEVIHNCYEEYKKSCQIKKEENIVFKDLSKSLNIHNDLIKQEEKEKEEAERKRKEDEEKKKKDEDKKKKEATPAAATTTTTTEAGTSHPQPPPPPEANTPQSLPQAGANTNSNGKSNGCCIVM